MKHPGFVFGLIASLCLVQAADAEPISYQGRLEINGAPASGDHELTFALYNQASGGSLVAGPIVVSPVNVEGGLFTAQIDFPDGSFASDTWLQITARALPSGSASTLSPRQQVTAAPASIEPWSRGPMGPVAEGRVGIGAPATFGMLEIDGSTNNDVGLFLLAPGTSTGEIQFSSPNGVPGIVAFANNGKRRDIRFGEIGMNFVTAADGTKPLDTNGLFITDSGRVGIGTTFPGARLDVIGNMLLSGPLLTTDQIASTGAISSGDAMYANEFRYNTPQEKVVTVPFSDFLPDDSTVPLNRRFGTGVLGSSEVILKAPVRLPDRARVTRVEFYGRDNSGSRDFGLITLEVYGLSQSSGYRMFSGNGPVGTFEQNVTVVLNPSSILDNLFVVDLPKYNYLLTIELGNDSGNRYARGAAVWYTMPGPE